MARVWIGFVAALLLGLTSPVLAASVQYNATTMHVTAATDTPITATAERPVIVLDGVLVSTIQWPVPAGCAQGMREWTRITNPAEVNAAGAGMALLVGPVFFSTTSPLLPGCHLTENWGVLRALLDETLIAHVDSFELVATINKIVVSVLARCPGATGGSNCDTARANMVTINTAVQPTAANLATFTGQVITMYTEATTAKQAACAANPGGPFC